MGHQLDSHVVRDREPASIHRLNVGLERTSEVPLGAENNGASLIQTAPDPLKLRPGGVHLFQQVEEDDPVWR